MSVFFKFSGAAALAAAAGLLVAAPGSAHAKNVLNCEGPSRTGVIGCCEAIVKAQGLPEWMALNHMNCRIAVACAPRRNTGNYCRVHYRAVPLEIPEFGQGLN